MTTNHYGKPKSSSRASPPPFSRNVIPDNVAYIPMDAVSDEVCRHVPLSFPSDELEIHTTATLPPVKSSSLHPSRENAVKLHGKRHTIPILQNDPQPTSRLNETPVEDTNGAVCFGWITHPLTKLWRAKIKKFSDNRIDYPTWNDDISHKVKILLQESGVTRFLLCPSQDGQRTKIGSRKGDCPGNWRLATPEDILEKTMQRFKDDRKCRKPTTPPTVKRPKGRPPKKIARSEQVSPETTTDKLLCALTSPMSILINLEQDLQKYRPIIGHVSTNMPPGESSRLTELRQQLSMENSRLSCEDTARLLQVTLDHECVQTYLFHQLEDALVIKPVLATFQGEPVLPDVIQQDQDDFDGSDFIEQILNEDFSLTDPVPCSERQPWYPIRPVDVCFEWNKHHATDKWHEVVLDISLNYEEYPEWNESICDCVGEKLAAEQIDTFCSFLDSQRRPCMSITEGMWYPATKEEIIEKTKRQFLANRKGLEDPNHCELQSLSSPPTRGSNGSDPPPKDSTSDSDDIWSDADDNDTNGFDNLFAGQDMGCQHFFHLAATHHTAELSIPLVTSSMHSKEHAEPAITATGSPEDDSSSPEVQTDKDIVVGATPPTEDSVDVSDKVEIPLPYLVLEVISADDNGVSDFDKRVSIGPTQKTLCSPGENSLANVSAKTVPFVIGSPILTAECSLIPAPRQALNCGVVLANELSFDGPEITEITSIEFHKDSQLGSEKRQSLERKTQPSLPLPPLEKGSALGRPLDVNVLPGAVRVRGSSMLQTDDEDDQRLNEEFVVSITIFDESADRCTVPLSDTRSIIPYRLQPLCDEMEEGEAYSIISEKLANDKWSRVLTSLDPKEFGWLISNIKMNFDRSRVAELLASRMLDQHGANGFTCQHAALAIQNTPFRAVMAERILPYCVDISSNLRIVKEELEDWDMSLLLISLCRKLQSTKM